MKKTKKSNEVLESNLIAEVSVTYRTKQKLSELPQISDGAATAKYLRSIWNLDTLEYKEDFVVLFLTHSNKVLGWARVSSGGLASTVVDPRVIFSMALGTGCCFIILAHNHPSGSLIPSSADTGITHKMIEAGKLLDIRVLDHVILSVDGFYSFAEEGLML